MDNIDRDWKQILSYFSSLVLTNLQSVVFISMMERLKTFQPPHAFSYEKNIIQLIWCNIISIAIESNFITIAVYKPNFALYAYTKDQIRDFYEILDDFIEIIPSIKMYMYVNVSIFYKVCDF